MLDGAWISFPCAIRRKNLERPSGRGNNAGRYAGRVGLLWCADYREIEPLVKLGALFFQAGRLICSCQRNEHILLALQHTIHFVVAHDKACLIPNRPDTAANAAVRDAQTPLILRQVEITCYLHLVDDGAATLLDLDVAADSRIVVHRDDCRPLRLDASLHSYFAGL